MPITSEITVKAPQFQSAVAWAAKWVSPKPVVPVHAGLMLTLESGCLKIGAFGENATARAMVEIAGPAPTSAEPQRAIVSGRLLAAIVATFAPGKPITITGSEDGGAVLISAGRFTATLPTMPEDDYPTLPGELPTAGTVAGQALADGVHRVGVACGIDHSATALNAMWIGTMTGGRLGLLASDGLRAAECSVPWAANENAGQFEATPLGAAFIDAAASLAGPDEIRIGADGSLVSLSSPTRSMTIRTIAIEGGYRVQTMRGFLSTVNPNSLTMEPAEAVVPLKRAAIMRGKKGPIRVRIEDGLLTLAAAEAETRSEGEEPIDVEYAGDPADLAFNPEYFADALHSAPGAKVVVAFDTNPRKPVLLSCPDDPSWRHILMPIVIR